MSLAEYDCVFMVWVLYTYMKGGFPVRICPAVIRAGFPGCPRQSQPGL